jgi:hypothetical protein
MAEENTVQLNKDGYIEVIVIGSQTGDSFRRIYSDALPFIDQLAKDNKPLLGLIDLTKETGFSVDSNKAALKLLEDLPYERIAMVHPPFPEVTSGIIVAMGKSDNTKVFKTKEEALKWLLDDN